MAGQRRDTRARSVVRTAQDVLRDVLDRGSDATENWMAERDAELARLFRALPSASEVERDAWGVAAGCTVVFQHTLRRLGRQGDEPMGRELMPHDVQDTADELKDDVAGDANKLPCVGMFARTMAMVLTTMDRHGHGGAQQAAELERIDAAIVQRTRDIF